MNISTFRKSQWLRKEDVATMSAAQRRTAVERITEEKVGEDVKPVLYLKGIEKGWPANITGLEVLAEMSGSQDTDDFVGLAVEVYVDANVRYQGQKVGGVKLRALTADSHPRRTSSKTPADDLDQAMPTAEVF
jgi:hypothetical protein